MYTEFNAISLCLSRNALTTSWGKEGSIQSTWPMQMSSGPHWAWTLEYLKIQKNGQCCPSASHTQRLHVWSTTADLVGAIPKLRISRLSPASPLWIVTTAKCHLCHIRVYPGDAPQNKWVLENCYLSLKPSNKWSAARATKAKSYRTHIMCVRSPAWPSGLGLGTWIAELACITDSFRVYLFWCWLVVKSTDLWLILQRDVVCKKNKQGRNDWSDCFYYNANTINRKNEKEKNRKKAEDKEFLVRYMNKETEIARCDGAGL